MNTPKISVIVPVYKVGQYLPRCIDSILAQTFTDFELLLIDDGSPDNSGKICDEYAKKDERIRVFHKENGGVSSARNFGLDNARGEWVAFVDSDDWIDRDYISEAIEYLMQGISTYIYGFTIVKDNQEIMPFSFVRGAYASVQYLNNANRQLACWGQFLSNDIIKKSRIRFDNRLSMSEDVLFMIQYLVKANTIFLSNHNYYYYRIHGSSVCQQKPSAKKVEAQLKAAEAICHCMNNKEFDQYTKAIQSIVGGICRSALQMMAILGRNERDNNLLIEKTKNIFDQLKNNNLINSLPLAARYTFSLPTYLLYLSSKGQLNAFFKRIIS